MVKNGMALVLIFGTLMATTVYSQEGSENRLIKNISGIVINVDAVGNIISIKTDDQKQMAFSVPDKVSITQNTRTIGLMDINKADPVTLQYYTTSSSKNIIVNIVDNESEIHE